MPECVEFSITLQYMYVCKAHVSKCVILKCHAHVHDVHLNN